MQQVLVRCPFVFMRHGESIANLHRRYAGSLDVELSARGRQQAISARSILSRPWSKVISSGLSRAIETAELSVPDARIERDPRLNERCWGVLEGQLHPPTSDYFACPDGAECWQDFESRVLAALNEILQRDELPLIVAHSGIYRALSHQLLGSPEGPRVGNAVPMLFAPQEENGWQITPFKHDVA